MFSCWNLGTWSVYSYKTDAFAFPAVTWPVVFSLPVTSLTFSSLVFAHQFCPGLTNEVLFLWHTSQTDDPLALFLWPPYAAYVVMFFIYTLLQYPSHILGEEGPVLCLFGIHRGLSHLEHFWGTQYPLLSLLQRWEVSSLMAHGEQGSHSGLELFLTSLFFFSSRQRML